jgi:hypothetical protein
MNNSKDKKVIRDLAQKIAEIAAWPIMEDRKRQWKALKDLKAERPMVLVESYFIQDFVTDGELICTDESLRGMEWSMRMTIKHAEVLGDDIVVEPCWRMWWNVQVSDYGIPIPVRRSSEPGVAYIYEHPIKTPADLDRLKPRTFKVDREATKKSIERYQDLFGDILPIIPPGVMSFNPGLTHDLFKLMGNDNLMFWMYDEPEALHRAMEFLCNDRLEYIDFLEMENLLASNNFCNVVGGGSYGYTSDLPPEGSSNHVSAKDMWVWSESQETTLVSPEMFNEFFLPYIAKVAGRFGLVYYGCCEQVHDRWNYLIKAIPHIRAVSVSPWCDMKMLAEMIGRNVVFSRKPKPAPVSGKNPDWDLAAQDIRETLDAARDCNLEFIFRDLYDINGDISRMRKWTNMVRSIGDIPIR